MGTSGRLAHGRASFGSASTDPAVQGPFQLTFQPVASGGASGGFIGSGSPLGLAGANGLYSEFQVALYIQVSGGEPVAAAGPSPGAGVGGGCVIGTAAAPLEADFLPTLTGFFGNRGAVAYDQARGTASLTATRLSFPGAQNCQGQESVVDQQLGIPGPGSISVNLKFGPVIVSSAYRAAHPPRHRRRTSKH